MAVGNPVMPDDIKTIDFPQGFVFESMKQYRDRFFVVLKNVRTKIPQYFEIRAVSNQSGQFEKFTFVLTSRKAILKSN